MAFLRTLGFVCVLVLLVFTAGCAAVAGIFKAGVWVGVIIAAVVVAIVLFLFSRLAR